MCLCVCVCVHACARARARARARLCVSVYPSVPVRRSPLCKTFGNQTFSGVRALHDCAPWSDILTEPGELPGPNHTVSAENKRRPRGQRPRGRTPDTADMPTEGHANPGMPTQRDAQISARVSVRPFLSLSVSLSLSLSPLCLPLSSHQRRAQHC